MDTLNLNIDDENKSNKTKNKSNFYSYEEKLLSVDGIQSTKTYEVEIFAKRTKLFPSMINFDHDNKEIIISPKSEDFKIKVSFMDFIGFVGLEDLEHTEANKINLIFPTENRNVEYASLNFYSKYSIRSCLCLGVFCCKCIEYVTERKAKVLFSLSSSLLNC